MTMSKNMEIMKGMITTQLAFQVNAGRVFNNHEAVDLASELRKEYEPHYPVTAKQWESILKDLDMCIIELQDRYTKENARARKP